MNTNDPIVNDHEPLDENLNHESMTADADDVHPASDGIVSVNSHGRPGSNLVAKIAFATLAIAVVSAAGLTSWNKYRIASNQEETAQKKADKVEVQPAQVGQARVFPDSPPPPETKEVLNGDGKVVKVDADGHIVPDIEGASPLASATPIGTSKTTTSGGSGGQAEPCRYCGDIVVTSSSASLAGAQPAPRARDKAEAYAELMSKAMDRSMPQPQPSVGSGVGDRDSENSSSNESDEPRMGSGSDVERVKAKMIGDRSMLLTKGKTIDCELTTHIISEMVGDVTCVMQNNVYSEDGRVLLLEKGSQASGKVGTVAQGQNRVVVVWDRILTPKGVAISLNSSGTDPLGAPGLSGYVDNRWMQRIGGAFMLSFIKDAIAIEVAKQSQGSVGAAAYQNTTDTGNKMTEMVLENSIHLKPILYKNQGETLSIFVARDLDFSSVYQLSVR